MFNQGVFTGKCEDEIKDEIKKLGFDPKRIYNLAGISYPAHKHPETQLIAPLSGILEVVVNDETFVCRKGDKIIIPGNAEHSIVIGNRGCAFFWSEKSV